MILAFEMNSMGTHHAPGNSATLQTFAHAVPDQTIRMHAHVSHLRELRGDPLLAGNSVRSPFHLITEKNRRWSRSDVSGASS
jgi:hypothetical protein